MQSCQTRRDQPEDFRRYFERGDIDQFRAKSIRDRLVKAVLVNDTLIHDCFCDRLAILDRFQQDVLGLRSVQETLLDEKISNLCVVHE